MIPGPPPEGGRQPRPPRGPAPPPPLHAGRAHLTAASPGGFRRGGGRPIVGGAGASHRMYDSAAGRGAGRPYREIAMLKRRRWPGLTTTAAGCLLFGALATAAVSTQRAIWGKTDRSGLGLSVFQEDWIQPFRRGWSTQDVDLATYDWVRHGLCGTGELMGNTFSGVGVTEATFIASARFGSIPCTTFSLRRSGWPWRAFETKGSWETRTVFASAGSSDSPPLEWSWQAPPWLVSSPDPIYVPLRPLLLGFVADTLLYSTVPLAALVAFKRLRHRMRQRTGHCPRCAYDRAGLSAEAACPECGEVTPT